MKNLNDKPAAGNWQKWDGKILSSDYISTVSFGGIPLLVRLDNEDIKIAYYIRNFPGNYIWCLDGDSNDDHSHKIDSWAAINY